MGNGLTVSVLDLVGTRAGESAGSAITRSVDLAQHVEQWGYKRYWLAEHHSISGLACSATPVLIGHVAGATEAILLADPEARKSLQATVQKQVESWIHQKIPALGGRTPLEAVRDPDGKEMVEALLHDWERHEERFVSPNQIHPDIGALRRLLSLAPPAS
jgi:hypothetical protein